MIKTYKAIGLDQIGPKHWLSEDEVTHLARLAKCAAKPKSLKSRIKSSATRRRVKITLAGSGRKA